MKKPIIGITCPWSVETWGDPEFEGGYYYVGAPYVEAVEKYGGVALLIPVEYREESMNSIIDHILDVVDGLMFSGGGDVKRKSDENLPTLRGQQPVRYDFELELMRKAYERDTPIMGICRGFQMIVELFGGSLNEDTIEGHSQKVDSWLPSHGLKIMDNTTLREILNIEDWDVNSYHIQQVANVPKDFIVNSKSTDGVIEGIESITHPYIVGFQFHPELLQKQDERAGKIFTWFLDGVSKKNT